MNRRNYGIDLLRMVSMLMVCVLHVLGQGGVLASIVTDTPNRTLCWGLEVFCYGATDIYALISGYVGVYAKHKPAGIVRLWLQVVFYTLGITLLFQSVYPEKIHAYEYECALLPVTHLQYWYFTAYFCAFFFFPYINKLLHSLSGWERTMLCLTIVVLLSLVPTLRKYDLFTEMGGYSFVWIMSLYVLGGCLRLSELSEKIPWYAFLILYLCCSLTAYFVNGFWVTYTSPLILTGSMALVMLFSRLQIGRLGQEIIGMAAQWSFGVYLIHTNPLIWNYVLVGLFRNYASYAPWKTVLCVLGTALAIYTVCSAVDCLRWMLFKIPGWAYEMKKTRQEEQPCLTEENRNDE